MKTIEAKTPAEKYAAFRASIDKEIQAKHPANFDDILTMTVTKSRHKGKKKKLAQEQE